MEWFSTKLVLQGGWNVGLHSKGNGKLSEDMKAKGHEEQGTEVWEKLLTARLWSLDFTLYTEENQQHRFWAREWHKVSNASGRVTWQPYAERHWGRETVRERDLEAVEKV